jgi:hypothetical protein
MINHRNAEVHGPAEFISAVFLIATLAAFVLLVVVN